MFISRRYHPPFYLLDWQFNIIIFLLDRKKRNVEVRKLSIVVNRKSCFSFHITFVDSKQCLYRLLCCFYDILLPLFLSKYIFVALLFYYFDVVVLWYSRTIGSKKVTFYRVHVYFLFCFILSPKRTNWCESKEVYYY